MNYYKHGDAANADKIKAAFERLGYTTSGFNFKSDKGVYYTDRFSKSVDFVSAPTIVELIKTHPDYNELGLPIEPCFKVWDKIEATIYGIKRRVTIREIDKTNRCYFGTLEECIGFSEQDQWHLAPKPHYDISNFKPFDKVLVRDRDESKWGNTYFGFYDEDQKVFVCDCYEWEQCIPFNDDNKHLIGTTEPCDERFINW